MEIDDSEAYALNRIMGIGDVFNQTTSTYGTIRKWWKNLWIVDSESKPDKHHYVGCRRIRQNDLYLLMYQDEVKVQSEMLNP